MSAFIDTLINADRVATLAVNDFAGAFTDAVMPVLSNRTVMIPLYVILFAYIWYRLGWKKALLILLAVVAAVCLLVHRRNVHDRESDETCREIMRNCGMDEEYKDRFSD